MDDTALLQAYRDSHYEVRLPGGRARCSLRIGQPLPAALHGWLGAAPLCAFITAYNPCSQPRAAALNRAAQQALLARLREWNARWLPGVGRLPGAHWREPSLLAAGLDLDQVDQLACAHSQLAVVIAHRNAAAELRGYPQP
jgi:Protein of unknown function (DUF3293)